MRDTRDIINDVAQEHYTRMNIIPEKFISVYRLNQRRTWEQLPEYDREQYRTMVAPIVMDTIAFAGL